MPPGARAGVGGTGYSPPALGSQTRDPAAPRAARRLPPSSRSGSGVSPPPTPLQRFSSLRRSPQGWPGNEPRGGAREESGGHVHSAEGPGAAHAAEDGIKCECLRGAEQRGAQGGCCWGRSRGLWPRPVAGVVWGGGCWAWGSAPWLTRARPAPGAPLGQSSHPHAELGPAGCEPPGSDLPALPSPREVPP